MACIAILCFSAIAVSAQIWSGAYRAELSSYPDEPAHAVTGLAFEQYIAHGLSQNPVGFLLDYYQHYPKVAVGHWPPLLYAAEAAAMLVFSPSKDSLLGLQALLAGILAWLVFRELWPLVGVLPASLGSITLLLNRQIQVHTSMTMAELLLTITMFLGCLAFARFAEERRSRDAMWFALWTTAAVWTKGTGWAMILVAAGVVAAIGAWTLPFDRALRLAALIGAVFCVPWQIVTIKSVVNGWDNPLPTLVFTSKAALQYCKIFLTMPGAAVAVAALVGAACVLLGGWSAGRGRPYWAAMASLVAGACLFNVLVPTSVEPRKVIMIVPPMFVLAAAGAGRLSAWISPQRQHRGAGMIFACLALPTLALSLPVEGTRPLGFIPVTAALDHILPLGSAALLVSDVNGEGSVISEFALRHPTPAVYLVRGTKLLASEDWDGRHYRNRVSSGEECERLLASVPISFLVVDRRKIAQRQEFFDFVEAMLRSYSTEWTLVRDFPILGDSPHAVALYRRSAGIEPARKLPDWIVPKIRWLD